MNDEKPIQLRLAALFSAHINDFKPTPSPDPFNDQPRKPDWLVLFMGAVLLLTLLIIWLVDIPSLLH